MGAQLGTMQKNTIKQQYRSRKRLLLNRGYGKIGHVVESCGAVPAVAARTERVQKALLEQRVIIGVLEEADRRLPALLITNHLRIVESVHGRPDHRPTETADGFCKLVGEGRLACPVNAVNCNSRNP